MKKSGFTLIEVVAIIVILALILAIVVPSLSNIINTSTKNAFEVDAGMLIEVIDGKTLDDRSFDPAIINEINIDKLLNVDNNNYKAITVSKLNGKSYIVINGKKKWDGLVAYGTITDMAVSDSSNYETIINQLGYDGAKGVNEPKLALGMTPIKWDGTKWVDTSEADIDWYNYNATDKKWANARTADGSMWVWIPRYIYKISSGWHSNAAGTIEIQFSKGIDDNWNNSVIGTINTGATSNASNNKWTNHPAFTFGFKEVTGIWVAKFEASALEGVSNGYTFDFLCPINGDNVTTKTIKIIPNAMSWRCITIGNAFTASRNMETNSVYGWGTTGAYIDTHLIKNTEWGAVAYLSKSNYGQGSNPIWINPTDNYTTGCSGASATSSYTIGCKYKYDSANGMHASTTSNIYGIYDITGGSWEYVSAYVDNGHGNLNTYGSSIISADSKYKDIYAKGSTDNPTNNYALAVNLKGDAIYETSGNVDGAHSWFGNYSYIPYTNSPWVLRGGYFGNDSRAGAFASNNNIGDVLSAYGFRPVLIVGNGL